MTKAQQLIEQVLDGIDPVALTNESRVGEVGFSWEALRGTKRIVKKAYHPRLQKEVLFIRQDGSNSVEFLDPTDLDFEVKRDTTQLTNASKAAATRDKELADQKAHDSWLGFTDKLPSTQKARAISVLNKVVSINREFAPRGDHIKRLVRNGYKVIGNKLESPSGSFFLAKDLTKIGLDFAAYCESLSPSLLKKA